MKTKKIVVLGSTNTDMVISGKKIPVPGETILGGHFLLNPGGKGANQAVAVARLSEKKGACSFIAKVGDDVFAQIQSDVYNTQEGYTSVDYTIQSGKLPAGLTLAKDGTISGKVTEIGNFHVVVKIEASKGSSGGGGGGFPGGFPLAPKAGGDWGGGGGGSSKETQTFAFDVIVTGEPVPAGPTLEERVEALEEEIEALAAAVLASDVELASAIASLKTQIEALAAQGADVSALKTALATLETKVAELEKASANKGGCGSSIVGGSVVIAAALASVAALLIHKKNKED